MELTYLLRYSLKCFWTDIRRIGALLKRTGGYLVLINSRKKTASGTCFNRLEPIDVFHRLVTYWFHQIHLLIFFAFLEGFLTIKTIKVSSAKRFSFDTRPYYHCVKSFQNTGIFSPNTGKYQLEKTPYLDTFHLVY